MNHPFFWHRFERENNLKAAHPGQNIPAAGRKDAPGFL